MTTYSRVFLRMFRRRFVSISCHVLRTWKRENAHWSHKYNLHNTRSRPLLVIIYNAGSQPCSVRSHSGSDSSDDFRPLCIFDGCICVVAECMAGSGHRRTRRSPGAPSAGGAQKIEFSKWQKKKKILEDTNNKFLPILQSSWHFFF